MLDVFPLTYPTNAEQRRHTVLFLSTTLAYTPDTSLSCLCMCMGGYVCSFSSPPPPRTPPDAPVEHQHPPGVLQRQGRRAELHPEPQPVPLHLPEGARAAHREEAEPAGDAHGGEPAGRDGVNGVRDMEGFTSQVRGQMAERLGSRASNLKVAGSIPGRAKMTLCP